MDKNLTSIKKALKKNRIDDFKNLRVSQHVGALSHLFQFNDSQAVEYILKTPNQEQRAMVLNQLHTLYSELGFFRDKNTFKVRNYRQQKQFVRVLDKLNISTINITYASDDILISEYVKDNRTLSDLWEKSNHTASIATDILFSNIFQAHSHDILVGDRWGPNELYLETEQKVYMIDFDICIEGPTAKEFELSFLIYHLSFFAQKASQGKTSDLRRVINSHLNKQQIVSFYNLRRVKRFLEDMLIFHENTDLYSWKNKRSAKLFVNSLHL